MGHGLKLITFYVQKYIAALDVCRNPLLVSRQATRSARICETGQFGQNTEIVWISQRFPHKSTVICVNLCKNPEIIAICYWSELSEVRSPDVQYCLPVVTFAKYFMQFDSMLITVHYLKKNKWNQPGQRSSHVTRFSSPAHKHASKFLGMISCFNVAPKFGSEFEVPVSPEVQTHPRPGNGNTSSLSVWGLYSCFFTLWLFRPKG